MSSTPVPFLAMIGLWESLMLLVIIGVPLFLGLAALAVVFFVRRNEKKKPPPLPERKATR